MNLVIILFRFILLWNVCRWLCECIRLFVISLGSFSVWFISVRLWFGVLLVGCWWLMISFSFLCE